MKTDKINMIINFSILALLIYLAVAIKDIKEEVVWPEGEMKPLANKITDDEVENQIKLFLLSLMQETNR